MKFLIALLLGMFALPAGAQEATPPVGVVERSIMLGQGEWAVPAVITLPLDARNVPAVALLHGFGPGTVDADVGPNKIFRETAWALALKGVASIHHAKRTTAHDTLFRARGRHATVAEEWIEDARAAVSALRLQPEIDGKHLYVAGHSASGQLAARIALETGAAGAILVSGGATQFQTPGR